MRIQYVLIDYENVQPGNLALLEREDVRIRLFIGANQGSLKRDIAITLQRLGPERAEYVEISGSGPNALDFHIAWVLGCLGTTDKTGFFHIISKDAGFDPLIAFLNARKIACRRWTRIEDIPVLRTLSESSSDEQLNAVVERLKGMPKNRPLKEKTLKTMIDAWFGKGKLEPAAVDRIVTSLLKRKLIEIINERIRYSL